MSKFNVEGMEIFGFGSVEESVGTNVVKLPKLTLDDNQSDVDNSAPAKGWWVDVKKVEDEQWISALCPIDRPAKVFHISRTKDTATATFNKSAKLSKRDINKRMSKYCDPQNLVKYNAMLEKFGKVGFEEDAALEFLHEGAK
jgi:hypothetical protein